MQNNFDDFNTALAALLKERNVDVTPDEVRRLADQYTVKPKRGRPKKINAVAQNKKRIGRPHSDESMKMRFRAMGLWVMLHHVDMPQMEKRGIIVKVSCKSRSFVDKAIAKLHQCIDLDQVVAAYSREMGKVLILPIEDAEALQLAWQNGADINAILENSETFHKLELPYIILPKRQKIL